MAHKHGHEADQSQSESRAFETRDVKVRPLAVFIAGLAIVGIVVYLVVLLMFRLFSSQAAREDAQLARPPAASAGDRLPPEPRIQANPGADMRRLREQDETVLTTYGWVDRPAGIARIPIDVAMRQVLEEGLAVRQPDSAPPASGAPAARAVTPPADGPGGGARKDRP
jgi:hypothetical protein